MSTEEEPENFDTPGPAQYSISKGVKIINHNSPSYKFPQDGSKGKKEIGFLTPGPGQYEADKYTIGKQQKIYDRILCYFGDKNPQDKFFHQDVIKKNAPSPRKTQPSPAVIYKKPASNDVAIMAALHKRDFLFIDKEKIKNPGPGRYQIIEPPKPKGTNGIKFPAAKELHESYLRKEGGPGPADYNIRRNSLDKGCKFQQAGRYIVSNKEKEFFVPGPGAYCSKPEIALHRFFVKPPAFSFVKAKSQTPKKTPSPSPLDYFPDKPYRHSPHAFFGYGKEEKNTEETPKKNFEETPLLEKKLKGYSFTSEKRKSAFDQKGIRKFVVGPCDYSPNFDTTRKRSAKGGKFGMSERKIS